MLPRLSYIRNGTTFITLTENVTVKYNLLKDDLVKNNNPETSAIQTNAKDFFPCLLLYFLDIHGSSLNQSDKAKK